MSQKSPNEQKSLINKNLPFQKNSPIFLKFSQLSKLSHFSKMSHLKKKGLEVCKKFFASKIERPRPEGPRERSV